MKLYLSSIGIQSPSALEALIGRPLDSCHAAILPNAKDDLETYARQEKIEEASRMLGEMGIRSKIVDLRSAWRDDELLEALRANELIWVMGGNPFILRYEMRRSGFEEAIAKLGDEEIVYAAESAGAIVAGKSLRGFEFGSQLTKVPDVIWEGLELVPDTVVPHVDVAFFSAAIDKVHEAQKGSSLIELDNSQAVLFGKSGFQVIEAESITT